jgi:hypothetical protein
MQVVLHPSDPDVMLLRYENSGDGIFYSRDGGETFTMLCGSSIPDDEGRPLQKLGPLAIGGDGAVLLGVFGGLYVDEAGKGCGWERLPAIDKWVSDLSPHPTDPNVTFGITSLGGAMNGVFRRNVDGSIEELGTKLAMLLNRLRVVTLPEGGLRFYISAVDGQIPIEGADAGDSGLSGRTAPNYVILHSDDLGETWTTHGVGLVDGGLRLEAVDPSNPDRIMINIARDRDLMTNEPLPDTLLVSDDRGESFAEWATVIALGGIAIADDGRVYLGERGDNFTSDSPKGIRVASELGGELELLNDKVAVRCLHLRGDELLLCQKFSFGSVSTEDGTFTPSFELIKAPALASCDGVDMEAVCRQQLCTGFCGSAHFPLSPMCTEVYESTSEGCGRVQVVVDGGVASDASVPVDAGGSGSTAGSEAGTGGVAGAAGAAGEASGCGACTVGAKRTTSTPSAVYVALLAFAFAFALRLSRRARAS